MGYTNATDKEIEDKDIKVSINSIQNAAYVKRLSTNTPYNLDGVIHYDIDNLYPEKIKSIKQRSHSLTSATKTLSDFITGDGFENQEINELEINSEGLTAYDLLRFISNEKADIAFAIHVNYNIQGEVIELNPIDFESLRTTKDSRLAWIKDWSSRKYAEKIVYYNFFNPENVFNEILEAEGIENYKGQIFYWTGTNKTYPLATFDAAIDSGQYQAESELFKLRNIQNDFMPSGALQYPKNTDNIDEAKKIKESVKGNATGSNNASRIVLIGTSPDAEAVKNIWTPFERSNVDKLFETQNKEAKEAIFSVFRQPMILGAINPEGGWPNAQEMEDAFIYYNSIVEQDRKEVEKALTKIFEASIFDVSEARILPKMLIKSEGKGKDEPELIQDEDGTE